MVFKTAYKPLFEVQLLHNYFLNDGTSDFSSMNHTDQKKRLQLYDISEFINIIPSEATVNKMQGHNMVFKTHKSGFLLYAQIAEGTSTTPFIAMADDLSLKFILKLKDARFGNYTNVALGDKAVFYFGNSKPSTEGAGFKYIPRSSDSLLVSDDFKLSANGTEAVTEGLKGMNAVGVFGIVELKMIGDSTPINVLTTQGKLKSQTPIFTIQFDNRKTFWRYKKAKDDSEIFTTAAANPLTKYGFIEVEHNGEKYPNPSANQLIPDNNKFYSEIYI